MLPKTWIVWVHETWYTLLQFFNDGFAYIQFIYLYIYITLEIKINKKVTYQKKIDKKDLSSYHICNFSLIPSKYLITNVKY